MFNVDTNVINSKLTGSNSSNFVGYRRFASSKLNGTTFWVPHVVLNPVPAQHNLLIIFQFTKSMSLSSVQMKKSSGKDLYHARTWKTVKSEQVSAICFWAVKNANTNKIGRQLTWVLVSSIRTSCNG